MFISMLLGGRIVYTGRDITAAHAGTREQGLNDTYFETFLNHFREALEEVGVKADKAGKVIKLLEGKRNAVLNRRDRFWVHREKFGFSECGIFRWKRFQPHSNNPFIRWDEKAGLQRDAIRSQCSTCSRHKEKETGYEKD
jgi:hypothetical protein